MTQPAFGTVAPTSRRAVAYIIDAAIAAGIGIVLSILLIVIAFSAGMDAVPAVLVIGGPLISAVLLGWFIVYTLMQSGRGSIGMRAQGIRLVRETDGSPLGFGMTLVRNIIFGLAASIVVGYFTPLFDGSGRFQGWHDKVAKSLILDSQAAPAAASAAVAPPTQAMQVPPRPPLPSAQPGSPTLATAPRPTAPQLPVVPRMPVPVMPAAPLPPATASEDALIAFVPGVTQDPLPAPAPAAAPAPAPALAADADEIEQEDIEETRISVPGHRLVFTWDDGTRVPVSGRTIFGRNPLPEPGAAIVSVRDETLSLSKTHFEASAGASGGWVVDRHSTNGLTIVRGGERIVCAPGEQVSIRLGDAIEIGDRIVTIGGYV